MIYGEATIELLRDGVQVQNFPVTVAYSLSEITADNINSMVSTSVSETGLYELTIYNANGVAVGGDSWTIEEEMKVHGAELEHGWLNLPIDCELAKVLVVPMVAKTIEISSVAVGNCVDYGRYAVTGVILQWKGKTANAQSAAAESEAEAISGVSAAGDAFQCESVSEAPGESLSEPVGAPFSESESPNVNASETVRESESETQGEPVGAPLSESGSESESESLSEPVNELLSESESGSEALAKDGGVEVEVTDAEEEEESVNEVEPGTFALFLPGKDAGLGVLICSGEPPKRADWASHLKEGWEPALVLLEYRQPLEQTDFLLRLRAVISLNIEGGGRLSGVVELRLAAVVEQRGLGGLLNEAADPSALIARFVL
jgi:hypothetical protein